MINILYDHQTFSLQAYGGISRYHAELIAGVNTKENYCAIIPLLFSDNVHLAECGISVNSTLPKYNIRGRGKFIYYSNQLYNLLRLKQGGFKVFHPTYYDTYFLPYMKNVPFVVTFHDMIYEKFSSEYKDLSKDLKIINNKKILAEKAARIIAVSENTKSDIIELLNISPDKVQVIYHGSSLQRISNKSRIGVYQPYLLFVGNRHMYKNFLGLLNAVHPLLKKNKIKVVCAGGGSLSQEERSFINSLDINDLVEHVPVDNQSLTQLYQNALAFVFPSFYEGFGIPILEAFACGCPCVVSNVSSLPEVAGDAVLYIDPKSSDSMIEAIEKLLSNECLRNTLIQKGYKQLTKFSWQRTVDETIKLYEEIA